MRIRYQFAPDAAVQSASYLLSKLGGNADKIKLMKLMYLADRDHFLAFGRPITGDSQWALPHGPVPSCTLNLLNGNDGDEADYVSRHIEVDSHKFVLRADPGSESLDANCRATLDRTLARYGRMHTTALRDLTHKLPEYIECEVPGSSSPIPYEVILKHHGGEEGFAMGRPVISPMMRNHLACPFSESEPDI